MIARTARPRLRNRSTFLRQLTLAVLTCTLTMPAARPAQNTIPAAAPVSVGATPPASTSSSAVAATVHLPRSSSAPVSAACSPQPSACGAAPLTQVDQASFRLPAAHLDQPYSQTLEARGGLPPYRFAIVAGYLPGGLSLLADGKLEGTPYLASTRAFTVQLSDAAGSESQQRYSLTVLAPKTETPAPVAPPAPPLPVPAASPAPAAAQPLTALSPAEARTQSSPPPGSTASTYRLTAATLAELKPAGGDSGGDSSSDSTATTPDAGAASGSPAPIANMPALPEAAPKPPDGARAETASPGPEPVALQKDQVAQLNELLKPMVDVEYPDRELFEAALDFRLCSYVRQMAVTAAQKSGKLAPTPAQLAAACPPDWTALASNNDLLLYDSSDLPLDKVAQALMPPDLRDWLIAKSLQQNSLVQWPAIQWNGNGCGCVLEKLSGQIYGFYPLWWASDKPQVMNFSLLSRISFVGLPFDDGGNLTWPDLDASATSDFIRTARLHETQIDFTLYRDDWRFLHNASADALQSAAGTLARQSVELIDTPLTDRASRAKAFVPGFATTARVGDGITVYFENIPAADGDLRKNFELFFRDLMLALIQELRKGGRDYVLNVVMNDALMRAPDSPWSIDAMFDYLKRAEDPFIQDNRIVVDSGEYRSNTNLTLRYVVLLSEPTTSNKKALRQFVESSPALQGTNRRVFLRKVIPVLATSVPDVRQFNDDMAYAADNFGGVGFWPTPMEGMPVAAHLDLVQSSFLSGQQPPGRVCALVCEYRWPLRVLFEVLLLMLVVAFALYYSVCRIRQIGLPYKAGLALAAVPTLLLGVLLTDCDPDLRPLREGNTLMWLLIAFLVITALSILLRPRVEKP